MLSKGKGYTRTLTVSNAFYNMMRLACYGVIVMSQGVVLKIYSVFYSSLRPFSCNRVLSMVSWKFSSRSTLTFNNEGQGQRLPQPNSVSYKSLTDFQFWCDLDLYLIFS